MNQVQEKTDELVSSLKTSEEYLEYQKYKTKIHDNPERLGRIHEYQRRRFELQQYDSGRFFEDSQRLQEEFQDVLMDPDANRYLGAEASLCKMIQEINWKITSEIDFEIGFHLG